MPTTTALTRGSNFSLSITSFEEGMRVAETIARTAFVPQDLRGQPGAVFAVMMMAAELQIGIMSALQGIAIINGKPSVYGDLALALCQRHPDFEGHIEELSADGTEARCTMKRRGRPDIARYFSMQDAERAGLLRKPGPWQNSPRRMLQMRARAYAMRDQFADALKGIGLREETEDYVLPSSQQIDGTAVVQAPPPRALPAAQPVAAQEPPMAAVVSVPIPTLHEAGDFQIKSGKNKGRKLSELDDFQIEWYAGECKDAQTKAAAGVVWPTRALYQQRMRSGGVTEVIDSDGVVHAMNNNGTIQ